MSHVRHVKKSCPTYDAGEVEKDRGKCAKCKLPVFTWQPRSKGPGNRSLSLSSPLSFCPSRFSLSLLHSLSPSRLHTHTYTLSHTLIHPHTHTHPISIYSLSRARDLLLSIFISLSLSLALSLTYFLFLCLSLSVFISFSSPPSLFPILYLIYHLSIYQSVSVYIFVYLVMQAFALYYILANTPHVRISGALLRKYQGQFAFVLGFFVHACTILIYTNADMCMSSVSSC